MSGTDIAYAFLSAYVLATRCPVLTQRIVLSAYARARRCPVLSLYASPTPRPCALRPVRGSVCSAISLRACYAMSGTDLASGNSRDRVQVGPGSTRLSSYTLATRCPVLT
eukprot:1561247-Rhodomonas_salina.1